MSTEGQVLSQRATRKVTRSIHEAARDHARVIAQTEAYLVSRREQKKVEMLFANLKRILKLDRLRLRGPCGVRDEFLLAATAQNLRKLAMLLPQTCRRWPEGPMRPSPSYPAVTPEHAFFNKIGGMRNLARDHIGIR